MSRERPLSPPAIQAASPPLHVLAVSRTPIPEATLREALGACAEAELLVDLVDDLRDVPAVLAEGVHDVLALDARLDPRAVLRLVEAASRADHHPPILFLPPPPPEAAPVAAGQAHGRERPAADLVEEVFRHALDASATRRALRASQSRFATLAEASAQGVIVLDGEGVVRAFNAAAERLLGARAGERIGGDAGQALPGLARADGTPFADDEHPLRLARWHTWRFVETPVRVRRGDGTEARLLLRAQRLTGAESGTGRALLILLSAPTSPGASPAPAAADGAVAAKAGRLAHDLNNLLHAIQGYAELLAMGLDPDDPRRTHLESLHLAIERAAGVTRQLRAAGAAAASAPVPTDLDAWLASQRPLLEHLLGARVRLDLALELGGLAPRLDPAQLEQAIMNLALNARDALPEGGRLRIATGVVALDEAFAAAHPGARPGRHVRLSVSDDGCGLDPATRSRAFEPYFTTKPQGRGSGLGLAVVRAFVGQHGGCVAVESAPGAGSTFVLYLPLE